MLKKRLMTPGPTPVHPDASLALAGPSPHHRTPEFKAIVTRLRRNLQKVFRTRGEMVLLTSSGTGAMEAAVTNLTRPGDVVIVVDSGKFGRRWVELCQAFQRKPLTLTPPPEQPVQPGEVAKALDGSAATALFFAACESSTGVQADTRALAAAARRVAGDDLLVVVDAITQVGAAPLETDAWDLDVVIGGSQKAFMIPPGLAFLALSPRAQQRLEETGGAGLYLDLARELEAQKKGSTAWTPSTALALALDTAVDCLLARGMETIWDETKRRALMTRRGVTAMGMDLFAKAPAVSLTAVLAPGGLPSSQVVAGLEVRFGIRIAGGQGDLRDTIFRMAHLGYIDEVETLGTLGALGIVVNQLGVPVNVPAGLAAAAEVMSAPLS
ncbi:MAG: pyridoxal-phosphate-dependent aminotransferase family protein [Acidobacteriota bacterium]